MSKAAANIDANASDAPWNSPLFENNALAMLAWDCGSQALIAVNATARERYHLAPEQWQKIAGDCAQFDFGSAPPDQASVPQPGVWRHGDDGAGSPAETPLLRYRVRCRGKDVLLLILQDADAPAALLQELERTRDQLRLVETTAHIGNWEWDAATGRHHFTSNEALRIFGLCAADGPLDNVAFFERIHPDDVDVVLRAASRAQAKPCAGYDVQFRVRHPDGSVHWVRQVATVETDTDGRLLRLRGVLQDISDQTQAAAEITRLAYYDDITGLPNRVLFRKRAGEALASTVIGGDSTAVAIVDLLRFRNINYTFGHLAGNELLRAVGARLAMLLDPCDVAAHISTRFLLMLPHIDGGRAAARARQILASFEVPFPIGGVTYELNARIGIALAPEHGNDTVTLLRKADIALYQAAEAGQSFAFYNAAHDPYRPRRLALIGELRQAIRNGELQLYCQPKADVRNGEIVGAESLVRWQHHEFGLIEPDQFIPLIEATDLIHVVTRFMLESSIRQCDVWRRMGIRMPLAVNLSTRNLLASDLTEYLDALLQKWDAQPDWLGLEITENSLMQDPGACIESLTRLSRAGFRLFVDDFGTGYSSLSYLTRLPVNVIKIDHGFTMQMTRDKAAATIVKSTIDLAHNLGMSVVAEGTASRDIWDALALLGCDEAQGYLISPPLPASEFVAWWESSPYRPSRTHSAHPAGPPHAT